MEFEETIVAAVEVVEVFETVVELFAFADDVTAVADVGEVVLLFTDVDC